ncbi:MAG: hypothetical protein P1U63_01950 [Coxiellaceae bacterium]|nr:hypothetical protein [Coxiellaceae bacterium]
MRDDSYTAIKAQFGALAGMLGNLTGAPFDRVRLDVVADKEIAYRVATHFRNGLTQGIDKMYVGGVGRGAQKAAVALTVSATPDEYKEKYPIISAGVAGAAAAWFGNIGRVGQINKLKGITYPQTLSHILANKAKFITNTAQFSAGESIRASVCFGTAMWLQRWFGEVDSYKQQVLNATKASFIVSGTETSAAWFFETVSATTATVHKSLAYNPMRDLLNPRYALRTSGTLMAKNVAANWPLITTLFLGNHLVKQLKQAEEHKDSKAADTKGLTLFSAVFSEFNKTRETTSASKTPTPS